VENKSTVFLFNDTQVVEFKESGPPKKKPAASGGGAKSGPPKKKPAASGGGAKAREKGREPQGRWMNHQTSQSQL
jgi:hypothetical protein